MTTPSGGLIGTATIRIVADTDPAILALNRLVRDADGSIRDIRIRVVSESRLITGPGGLGGITTASTGLTSTLGGLASGLGGVAGSIGLIGAAAGSALPLVAGLAAGLANVAPAAAGAATAFLALQQAQAVIRLGMVGVEDAISAAFATGEGSAEAFQESLSGLAPSARDFVLTVRDLRDEFTDFQQSIQQELFTELDDVLRDTAESVLPVLEENLLTTASVLSDMGASAAQAASELADNGTLGQAMEGANVGLTSLSQVPAQVVTALGQLAAAGAPVFEGLTARVANAATDISASLSTAFATGELQDSVESAFDVLLELGRIALDVFEVVQNVLRAATVEGADLFAVIGTIVGVLETFTASSGFQDAIGALVETMSLLATSAAPLLISALSVITPIFVNLAAPVQALITALAAGLAPVIDALGPVLDAASSSLGAMVAAVAPLLPVVGALIAQLGPVLTPILQQVGVNAALIAPALLQLVQVLVGALSPILAVLPSLIQPILDAFTELAIALVPLLTEVINSLEPVIDETSLAFIDLLVALAPVITQLLLLATDVIVALTPVLIPLIGFIVQLSTVFNSFALNVINRYVIPALNAISALLRGDFSDALDFALDAIGGLISAVVSQFIALPRLVFNALSPLGSRIIERVSPAMRRMGESVANGVRSVVDTIQGLPGRALRALGNLSNDLFDAGRDLIQGFLDGILSLADDVSGAVGNIIEGATGWLPGSPAEYGPLSGRGYVLYRGQAFSEDFARGISSGQQAVDDATRQLAVTTSQEISAPLSGAVGVQAVSLGGTPVPVQIELTLINHGVMGSRVEVLDWLTGAIEELRRQNRLRVVA